MDQAMRAQPPEEEPEGPGVAGYGAVGGRNVGRSNTLGSRLMSSSAPVNDMSPSWPSTAQSAPTAPTASTPATSLPSSANGTGERTMLAIGGGVYEVGPQRDPQSAPNSAGPVGPSAAESRWAQETAHLRSKWNRFVWMRLNQDRCTGTVSVSLVLARAPSTTAPLLLLALDLAPPQQMARLALHSPLPLRASRRKTIGTLQSWL